MAGRFGVVVTLIASASLLACQSSGPAPAADAIAVEPAAQASAGDTFEPANGVVCERGSRVCEWRGGPTVGLTRLFFGDDAAEAAATRVASASYPNDPIFKPNPDASCDTLVTTCYDRGGASEELTSRFFGADAARRLAERRAEVVRYGAHVTCDKGSQICFDRFGAGVGITQLYIGQTQADALLARLRARDR